MMKIKTCCIALVLLLLLSSGLVVSAAEKTYLNTETNYKALIMDDNDLLTDEEEAKLLQDMQPLTEYCNFDVSATIHLSLRAPFGMPYCRPASPQSDVPVLA